MQARLLRSPLVAVLLALIMISTSALGSANAGASSGHLFAAPVQADGQPDLVVTDVTWSPASPYTGDAVRFSAVVQNRGAAPTPEGVVIGGVFRVDDSVVSYTDTYKSSVAPGASVTVTANGGGSSGNGTWIAQEGTHTVGFLVDDVNRIAESDESNNDLTLAQPLTVTTRRGPNLVVTGVAWSPVEVRAGSAITFSAMVANQGTEPTPAGAAVTVRFSVDGVPVGTDARYSSPLAPGGSATITASGAWSARAGTHRVATVVDPADRIAEIREDDNALAIDFAVARDGTEVARRSDSFVDSIGVATHLSYYDTPYGNYEGIVKPRFRESGIRHLRDGADIGNQDVIRKLNDLATIGVHSTLILDWRHPEQAVEAAKALKPSLAAVEGANEVNIFNPELFPDQIREYHNRLYAAIKADPQTAYLPVLAPSLAYGTEDSEELGPVSCDVGNMHPYQGGHLPDAGLADGIAAARDVCPGKPYMATETGYNNALNSSVGQPAISEQAGAKYIPRTYLDFFRSGVQRTFVYEFIDEFYDPDMTNPEARFGIVRRDGTPKPAFVAMKNLIGLLGDRGPSFTPGTLRYTLGGNVTNLRHVLLQKRDGRYYLVLWLNARSYDLSAKKDVDVPPQSVTLGLQTQIKAATTYLPSRIAEPRRNYLGPKTIVLSVPDEPLVVELTPGKRTGRPGLPDLVVERVRSQPAQIKAEDEVRFSATILNAGRMPTPPHTGYRVAFQVDGKTVAWGQAPARPLGPGERVTVTAQNGPAGSATWAAIGGRHTIGATVDDQRQVTEADETNNSSEPYTVDIPGGTPDLTVTGLASSPAEPQAWDDVVFEATVTNRGSGTSPEGVDHVIEFTVDGQRVALAVGHTQGLAPGDSVTLTANAGGPGDRGVWAAVYGDHTVAARVDPGNLIEEKDETNNTLQRELAVRGDPAAPGPLPQPWQNRDIGDVGIAGKAGWRDGKFTLKGSGSDIWDSSDQFHFVYQGLHGDGEITARVTSLTNTNGWAKAGLMIRESLTPGSRNVSVFMTPDNSVNAQGRESTGGGSYSYRPASLDGLQVPQWVRLVRQGDTITSYVSADGADWKQVDAKPLGMGEDVYVGLALTSHDNTQVGTATFENVSVTP